MENNKKVIELEVVDELEQSGVSAISLVDVPAIEKNWLAFKREAFVDPKAGESEDEYVSRCIGVLVGDEGYETDQAAAICYNTYREKHTSEEFAKVSFDWNETLSTDRGLELAKSYVGDTLYIISAISEVNQAMLDRAAELGIPESRVFATGSNKAKVEKIKELGIDKHIDNSAEVISALGSLGQKFEFAKTYTDYPESAVNAAKRALAWAEENGWGDCGMGAGKARANQLANREPISEETIARISSFARHEQNKDTPYGEGCGKLMWDSWGGTEMIMNWAPNKLKSIREEMSIDTGGLPAYVDEIPKKKKEEMESEELDIYGYRTSNFHMCPGAIATFTHLLEMSPDEDTIGMIRAAAVIADRIFDLEEDVIEDEYASYNDVKEALVLTEDFFDVMGEIDKALGMEHNVDYMIGHVEKIKSYYKEEFAPASGNPGDRPLARIPKEERGRTGSDKNEPGDTKTSRGGIEVPADVEETLRNKIEEHNKANPQESQKADLGMLKAVWRRGAGAYSVGTPGKRGMARPQWAMARVNAFLNILAGKSSGYDKDYNQDNDLLPKGHPKHSEEKMSKMFFASEDKQIVVGPAMIPDMEILRKEEKTKKPYYVKFSKDVISKIAEKFMRELRNANTNVQHDEKSPASSYVMESWIVENAEDKANTLYGLDLPVGSWVVKMRVQSPEIWKQIKAGKLNGFSIEGDFMDKKDYDQYQKDKELYNKVIKILKSI